MKKILWPLAIVVALALLGFLYLRNEFGAFNLPAKAPPAGPTTSTNDLGLTLPPGFSISVFAEGVTGARVMTMAPGGVMLVSEPGEGKIVALPDRNGDGRADEIAIVAEGLNKPHGLAFRCTDPSAPDRCELYVGETSQLSVFSYDAASMRASNKRMLVRLPTDGINQHATRSLLFMPSPNENLLLISVGSSCNVCEEDEPYRAKILAYDISTGKTEEYARGLRNSVFMEIHPVTGAIWATEMGRDFLGDDIPPDEINIIEKGKNYGWPICYGKNIHDTEFDKNTYIRNPCQEPFEAASYIDLQAHSAPLGLAFIPEEGWPEDLWYDLLVAYHGSWNRSVPTGYKIVRFALDEQGIPDGGSEPKAFIDGWLAADGKRLGRPVDIEIFPGGVIYISDDQADRIYRVVRQ